MHEPYKPGSARRTQKKLRDAGEIVIQAVGEVDTKAVPRTTEQLKEIVVREVQNCDGDFAHDSILDLAEQKRIKVASTYNSWINSDA